MTTDPQHEPKFQLVRPYMNGMSIIKECPHCLSNIPLTEHSEECPRAHVVLVIDASLHIMGVWEDPQQAKECAKACHGFTVVLKVDKDYR